MRVRDLFVHPLKSGAGVRVPQATLDPLGLAGDRRWMAVDARGAFLSQRRMPKMALIGAATLDDGALQLTAPGQHPLRIARPAEDGRELAVTIWDDRCLALDGGAEAARWISTVLNVQARLVHLPPPRARIVDRAFASGRERVGLADGFPLLVLHQASLDDLNARLTADALPPVPVTRFRPNIVVEGGAAYDEDAWPRLLIGEGNAAIPFDLVKPCARCSIISVDPATGVQGTDPMRTLATYRKRGDGVYFGQNALHRREGIIRVGDPVRVVQSNG